MSSTTIGWLLICLFITVVVVYLAIAYAHRQGMLDRPGQRRSHTVATPRGGGIGIVASMLVCLPGVLWKQLPGEALAGLLAGLALVATAGWWDDHRSLPVLPRLGLQLLGVILFSAGLLGGDLSWWWLPLLILGGAWSVNLHNFMDGIDGMLAQQVVFAGAGLAMLAIGTGQPALSASAGALAIAGFGFWCFNRAPARIFMGDVGSGSVGFLLFAFTAMLWRVEHAMVWPAMILLSTFVVDATLTLLLRIWHGRRWYAAHREHLYQWMVRRGDTHARVSWAYTAWNLLIVLPLAWFAWSHLTRALPITIGAYMGSSLVWLALKRYCLRKPARKAFHAAS